MRLAASTRPFLSWARLVGSAGMALTLSGLALYVLFFTPTGRSGDLEPVFTVHIISALLALLGVLLSVKWPLASALVLWVAFFGSLVVGAGWYLMMFPGHPFQLVGFSSLLYGVAAALMYKTAALSGVPRRETTS